MPFCEFYLYMLGWEINVLLFSEDSLGLAYFLKKTLALIRNEWAYFQEGHWGAFFGIDVYKYLKFQLKILWNVF